MYFTKPEDDNKFIKMGDGDFISINEIKEAGRGTDMKFVEKDYSPSAKRIGSTHKRLVDKIKSNNDFIKEQQKKDLSPKEEAEVRRRKKETKGLQTKVNQSVKQLKKLGYFVDKDGNIRNKEIDKENYKWAKRWMQWFRTEEYDKELYEKFYTGKQEIATFPGEKKEYESNYDLRRLSPRK